MLKSKTWYNKSTIIMFLKLCQYYFFTWLLYLLLFKQPNFFIEIILSLCLLTLVYWHKGFTPTLVILFLYEKMLAELSFNEFGAGTFHAFKNVLFVLN